MNFKALGMGSDNRGRLNNSFPSGQREGLNPRIGEALLRKACNRPIPGTGFGLSPC